MASSSAQDLLDAVNASILACLTAKIYSQSGRSKQMAELRDLKELRQQLIDEIANSAGPMFELGKLSNPSAV